MNIFRWNPFGRKTTEDTTVKQMAFCLHRGLSSCSDWSIHQSINTISKLSGRLLSILVSVSPLVLISWEVSRIHACCWEQDFSTEVCGWLSWQFYMEFVLLLSPANRHAWSIWSVTDVNDRLPQDSHQYQSECQDYFIMWTVLYSMNCNVRMWLLYERYLNRTLNRISKVQTLHFIYLIVNSC